MARALTFALLAAALLASAQQTTTQKKAAPSHKKSSPPQVTHGKPAAAAKHGKSAPAVKHGKSAPAVKHGKAHSRRTTHVAAAPSYQLHPDPERYQQIQQALADRGYFKGAVNGQWNDDSVDALKRFQADQKLDAEGKIDALTLTGLGLGPRHDGSTAGTVPLSATDSATNPAAPPPLSDPPR